MNVVKNKQLKEIIKNIKNVDISVVQTENEEEEDKLYNNEFVEDLIRQNKLGEKDGLRKEGLEVIFFRLFIKLFKNYDDYDDKKISKLKLEENDNIKTDIDFIIKQSIIDLNSKNKDNKINSADNFIRKLRLNQIETPLKNERNKLDTLSALLHTNKCDDDFDLENCSKFLLDEKKQVEPPSTTQIIDETLNAARSRRNTTLKKINNEADGIFITSDCSLYQPSTDAVKKCNDANLEIIDRKNAYIKRHICYELSEDCDNITQGGKSRKCIAPLRISNIHRSKHSRISLPSNRRSYRRNKSRSKKQKKTKRYLRH